MPDATQFFSVGHMVQWYHPRLKPLDSTLRALLGSRTSTSLEFSVHLLALSSHSRYFMIFQYIISWGLGKVSLCVCAVPCGTTAVSGWWLTFHGPSTEEGTGGGDK